MPFWSDIDPYMDYWKQMNVSRYEESEPYRFGSRRSHRHRIDDRTRSKEYVLETEDVLQLDEQAATREGAEFTPSTAGRRSARRRHAHAQRDEYTEYSNQSREPYGGEYTDPDQYTVEYRDGNRAPYAAEHTGEYTERDSHTVHANRATYAANGVDSTHRADGTDWVDGVDAVDGVHTTDPADSADAADASGHPPRRQMAERRGPTRPYRTPKIAASADNREEIEELKIRYIVGRRAGKDIAGPNGEVIVCKGEAITRQVIAEAEEAGKLVELILNMVVEDFDS
ncbi:hypothetical protein JZ785_20075 [Alicyclobacillus curvatus]|nr:hypothetical protein JZ785_20075 [Alicyclobacillus curvatus]